MTDWKEEYLKEEYAKAKQAEPTKSYADPYENLEEWQLKKYLAQATAAWHREKIQRENVEFLLRHIRDQISEKLK
jgi:predicted nuclease of restriction endonuclease-like RecB superfamily